MLIGSAVATGVFLVNAPWFIHGPLRAIEIARAQAPLQTAIVYVEPETFEYGYFPMVYQTDGATPQWLAKSNGLFRLPGGGADQTLPLAALDQFSGLIVVDIRVRRYPALRDCLHDLCPAFASAHVIDDIVRSGRWSIASATRTFGFYDTVVTRMAKVRVSTRPNRKLQTASAAICCRI